MNTISAVLLWAELLLSLLLIMAAIFAWTARWSRTAYRVIVRILFVIAALVPVLAFLGLSLVLRSMELVYTGLTFSLPLAILLVIGVLVLGFLSRPRVAGWPALRLCIAAAVALSLTFTTLWNMNVSSRMRMQIERADASALALSVAPPMVPDEQNAALVYSAVAQMFGEEKTAEKFKLLDEVPIYDDVPLNMAQRAVLIDQLEEIIDLVEQGASRPYCRFDHPYSRPSISVVLPELAWSRRNANLLSYAAAVEAYRGKPERALQLVSSMYRMGEHASNSPWIVGGLVAIGIGNFADETLLSVLPSVTDPKQLSSLHLPPDERATRIMNRALVFEEAYGASAFLEIAENPEYARVVGSDSGQLLVASGTVLSRMYSWPYEIDAYRQALQVAHEASATPVYQWKESKAQILKRVVRYKKTGVLTDILMPSLTRAAETTSRVTASRRMAEMAVAATRYRLQHNRYPASADELVPTFLRAIPIDPFDGQPLRMKPEAEGLLFYSIGEDRTDNGGEPNERTQSEGDIVHHLKNPGNANLPIGS